MSILHFCDEMPASVKPTASVAQTIRLMLDRRVGAVAVVDEEHKVAGIFTERDVLRKLALSSRDPELVLVHELMTTPVEMATPEMSPREALEVMVDRHYRHLPIIDNDGHLLGMLSIRNLLQAQIDELRQDLDSLEHYVSNDGPGG
ncbi:MAG TPA: CBS domain-containing protein [Terriglobales bacterium]|jgi:CBS domain-containing protein|nr:CBS domain-containing protein [Terriglobales bacterium]